MIEDGLFDRFGRPDVVLGQHAVRARVLAGIERIVRAEAAASDTTRDPEITTLEAFPAVINDVTACLVLWLLGGADPALFAGVAGAEDLARIVRDIPSNHSPLYAPVIEPTLSMGVAALVTAARTWLPAAG